MFRDLTIHQMASIIRNFASSDACLGCRLESQCGKDFGNCTLTICRYLEKIQSEDVSNDIDMERLSYSSYYFPENIDYRVNSMIRDIQNKTEQRFEGRLIDDNIKQEIWYYVRHTAITGLYIPLIEQFWKLFTTYFNSTITLEEVYTVRVSIEDGLLTIRFPVMEWMLEMLEEYKKKQNEEIEQLIINELDKYRGC